MVLVVDLGINVFAIRRGNHSRCRLVVSFDPAADFNFGMGCGLLRFGLVECENHEQPRMTLESLFKKWTRHCTRLVRQQLCFNPMDSGGLLQGLDNVGQ